MWHFVISDHSCSTPDCDGEVVLTDSATGERLCRSCAEKRPLVLEEARAFLDRYNNMRPARRL
jgi:hypothetical protein